MAILFFFLRFAHLTEAKRLAKQDLFPLNMDCVLISGPSLLHLIRRLKKKFWSIKTIRYTNKQFHFNDGCFKITHDAHLKLKTSQEIPSICFLPDLLWNKISSKPM